MLQEAVAMKSASKRSLATALIALNITKFDVNSFVRNEVF